MQPAGQTPGVAGEVSLRARQRGARQPADKALSGDAPARRPAALAALAHPQGRARLHAHGEPNVAVGVGGGQGAAHVHVHVRAVPHVAVLLAHQAVQVSEQVSPPRQSHPLTFLLLTLLNP